MISIRITIAVYFALPSGSSPAENPPEKTVTFVSCNALAKSFADSKNTLFELVRNING